jgi:hypothetical protein
LHPGLVTFEDDEVWQSDRLNAALLLGKTPEEIDQMSIDDVYALFDRHNANEEIRAAKSRRKR